MPRRLKVCSMHASRRKSTALPLVLHRAARVFSNGYLKSVSGMCKISAHRSCSSRSAARESEHEDYLQPCRSSSPIPGKVCCNGQHPSTTHWWNGPILPDLGALMVASILGILTNVDASYHIAASLPLFGRLQHCQTLCGPSMWSLVRFDHHCMLLV